MLDKLKFRSSGKSGLPKRLLQNKIFFAVLIILISVVVFVFISRAISKKTTRLATSGSKFTKILETAVPTPTPTPTPKPLTFAEMNALYGPCVHLPTLMYHRVQTKENADANKQTSISVYTEYFDSQMQYLKDKGYSVATMNDLVNFFDNGTKIPAKSVLLTFDDGYKDFYLDAYPILQKYNYPATVFVATGLIDNSGYLAWNEIVSMQGILFANHTWSHKNVGVEVKTMEYEILTADTQLADHNLNSPKIFAYPYGLDTRASEKYLEELEYKAAFTTIPGSTLCKKQRFMLPRIRIGNISLASYGF